MKGGENQQLEQLFCLVQCWLVDQTEQLMTAVKVWLCELLLVDDLSLFLQDPCVYVSKHLFDGEDGSEEQQGLQAGLLS